MATEREARFPVQDFLGIDRQVNQEDITDFHFRTAQNLWEKELGILETRGGSEQIESLQDINNFLDFSDFGSIPDPRMEVGNIFSVYDTTGNRRVLCHLHYSLSGVVDQVNFWSPNSNVLPAGVSVSFVNESSANWNRDFGGSIVGGGSHVTLRFVGYGVDRRVTIAKTAISGFSASDNQKLVIDVTQKIVLDYTNFDSSANLGTIEDRVTGIEIYSFCDTGSSGFNGQRDMWCGFCDLSKDPHTGTFEFTGAPLSDAGASATALATSSTDFEVSSSFDVSGTLEPGQSYYVTILRQHFVCAQADQQNNRCLYRQPNVNVANLVKRVTILPGQNSITLSGVAVNTQCALVMIGTHPRCLAPYGLWNLTGTNQFFVVTDLPESRPGAMGFNWTSATNATLTFAYSDYSTSDMFVRVEQGEKLPVFISRSNGQADSEVPNNIATGVQGNWIILRHQVSTGGSIGPGVSPSGRSMLYDGDLDFVNYDNLVFCVSDFNQADTIGTQGSDQSGFPARHNYVCTDGVSALISPLDYQSPTPPYCSYITKYQDAVVIGGSRFSEARTRFYFTRTIFPFHFGEPGSPTNAQYLEVDSGGEPIVAIGSFANTTATTGTAARLFVGKRNSCHIFGGELSASSQSAFLDQISAQNGPIRKHCMKQTPIGLLYAAIDNVYVVRETGEPTPVGDPISALLKRGDLSKAVASFHEEQFKLSFYMKEYDTRAEPVNDQNNVELWLDFKKMKQYQGKPVWNGPMRGRSVDYAVTLNFFEDGPVYEDSNDRWAVDRVEKRVGRVDIPPEEDQLVIEDFGVPVVWALESKDYKVTAEDDMWNKLVKRMYWKIRCLNDESAPLEVIQNAYTDGLLHETKNLNFFSKSPSTIWREQSMIVHPNFPTGRMRGRTIRYDLMGEGRVGIGGLALHYQVERRRI